MRCPFCGADNDRVCDSRVGEDGASIRRRRRCLQCGQRHTTYERYEQRLIKVIKKNRMREPFQREKIRNGLERACWKRPISAKQIASVVAEIEQFVYDREEDEIESRALGDLVMARLQNLDQVAFVRFASVYREYQDVRDFVMELRPMLRRESS